MHKKLLILLLISSYINALYLFEGVSKQSLPFKQKIMLQQHAFACSYEHTKHSCIKQKVGFKKKRLFYTLQISY